MLDRELRSIFVHVPKTGGQSIEMSFLRFHGLRWEERAPLLLRQNTTPGLGPPALAHLSAQEYVSLGYTTRAEFESYFKFAFVRDPWSRLVSAFRYMRLYRSLTFRRFVDSLPPTESWGTTAMIFRPQADYIFDDDDNCLVDFVGRTETLFQDFGRVRASIGKELPDLDRVNESARMRIREVRSLNTMGWWFREQRGSRNDYRSFYNDTTAQRVADVYKRDVKLFSFEFGGGRRPVRRPA